MKSRYRILSFDGGGYRGLFTLRVLQRLQVHHGGVLHHANMLAGVSTGGLIALGLAAGHSTSELISTYMLEAERIFADSPWDDVRDLGGVLGAEYSLDGLRHVAQEMLGEETTLGELADRSGKALLIAAYGLDLETPMFGAQSIRLARPKFFSSFDEQDRGLFASDIALATAAAPTYFPAWHGYIDGGIVTPNPVLAAITEALNESGGDPSVELGPEHLAVLSFGTGISPTRVAGAHEERELDWGLSQWAHILPTLMLEGQTYFDHTVASSLARASRMPYARLDALMPGGPDMDEHDQEATQFLKAAANSVDLTKALEMLRSDEWGQPRGAASVRSSAEAR